MSEAYLCDANASAERRRYAESFGQRLVSLMDAAGMTVSKMHSITGLSENTISRYRTGQTEPTLYVIFQIANVLGCTADELLGMNETEPRYRVYSGPGIEVRVAKEGRSPSTIFLAGNRAVAVYGTTMALEMRSEERDLEWIT
jgi:transcriptional regulator with XRE-family HTH domain